jgi:hypothetical protein
LFSVRPAYWYIERDAVYGQGDSEYAAKNPPFGATFTYYLPDKYKSPKEIRQEKEKELNKTQANVPFPGWEALEDEKNKEEPAIVLTIKDTRGNVVNTIPGTNKKGFNRVAWGLDYANREGISLKAPTASEDDFFGSPYLATPGTYSVALNKRVDGEVTALAEPITFEVKALGEGALPSKPSEDIEAFRNLYQLFRQDLMATNTSLSKNLDLVKAMKRALDQAERPTPQLRSRIVQAEEDLQAMDKVMNGSTAKNEIGERNDPSPQDGVFMGMLALSNTYGPTENQQQAFNRANGQLASLKANLRKVIETTIPELEKALKDAGAPWIEGQGILK